METKILKASEYLSAVEILKNGGIVGIPTETVYGLAADAFNDVAISKVFEVKRRPADNPLILHIGNLEMFNLIISDVPVLVQRLINKFWPGPLTIIVPKTKQISNLITAGRGNLAIRFPSHKLAQKIINTFGRPLVAPSANISGHFSPTKVEHVLSDLGGSIDAIVDGGDCDFGVESTIIDLCGDIPKILRFGKITLDDLQVEVGKIDIEPSLFKTKHKHYSNKTKIVIVKGDKEQYCKFVNSQKDNNIIALCFDQDIPLLNKPYISYGDENNSYEQAQRLFESLRRIDKMSDKLVYAHLPNTQGLGLTIYQRLIMASNFEIKDSLIL